MSVTEFEVSSELERLDLDLIQRYLSEESYWAQGRSRDVVARTVENSLCFGMYDGNKQIAFARVITDYAVHAYIADVFVLEPYRGRGLGKRLVASILAHPQLQQIQKWSLDTRDAHGLYEQFGFEKSEYGRHMALRKRSAES